MNPRSLPISREAVSTAQGVFYAMTGLWPLLHIKSFEAVTGPKADRWLVKTVGALVLVVGTVLATAGMRRKVTSELTLLAAGSAVAFVAIDTVYVGKGRISRVYFLDAVAELGFLAALLGSRVSRTGDASPDMPL